MGHRGEGCIFTLCCALGICCLEMLRGKGKVAAGFEKFPRSFPKGIEVSGGMAMGGVRL